MTDEQRARLRERETETDRRVLAALRERARRYPPGHEPLRHEILGQMRPLFPSIDLSLKRLERSGLIRWELVARRVRPRRYALHLTCPRGADGLTGRPMTDTGSNHETCWTET